MTTAGWLFMTVSWGLVLGAMIYSFRRVLTSKKHWTKPEDDIRELHHGEFENRP